MRLGTGVNIQYEKVDLELMKIFKKKYSNDSIIYIGKVILDLEKIFKKIIQKIEFNLELVSGKYLEK